MFSNPVAVGSPVFSSSTYAGLPTEAALASYVAFKGSWSGRETRVLIGSEDGFLHGIVDRSADTDCTITDETTNLCPNGTEAWGIVPSSLVKQLPATRSGPQLMVDGTTAVADVCWAAVGSDAVNCTASDWRTVAIGSLRGGGQSVNGGGAQKDSEYFAFDITDAGFPTALWRYDDRFDDSPVGSDDDLGLTYSTPTIGRVKKNGISRWVAFAGGGRCQSTLGVDAGVDDEGDGIYILDMQTGRPDLGSFPTKFTGAGDCSNFVARPATFKRTGKVDVETAYYGDEQGEIWAQRTWDTSSSANWDARLWYSGWESMSGGSDTQGTNGPVWYIAKADESGFTGGQRYDTGCRMKLGSGGTFNSLPASAAPPSNCSGLSTHRPIFGRPRVAFATDTSLTKPDLFFGTGDAQALDNTGSRDFFFAVHDQNFAPNVFMSGARQRGQTSFVYMFDPGEKVLGEPVFVGGSVVIATYAPPLGGTCNQLGDSYLYAFDPRTGVPRPTLRDPSLVSSTFKSVVKLTGVGAISDPIVVNGGLYYADGRGDVKRVEARPVGFGGRIQGWRRVR